MQHPKDIGDRSTLAIVLALHAQGYTAHVPFGENTRCDLIIYDGRRISRVQCKTGRLLNDPARPPAATYEIGRVDLY